MTHRMLAADENHTAMLWWEGRYPSMLPNEKEDIRRLMGMNLGKTEVEAVVAASPDALKFIPGITRVRMRKFYLANTIL